jgi:fucose permease
LVVASHTGLDAFGWQEVGISLFAFNRFLASLMCYLGVPGWIILLISVVGCVVFSALAMALHVPTSNHGRLACLLVLAFFEGPIYPTMFAISLRNLGHWTKLVTSAIVVALSGAAIWPSVAWAVEESHPGNSRYAMCIIVALNSAGLAIVLFFSLHPKMRRWIEADCQPTRRAEQQRHCPQEDRSAPAVAKPGPVLEKGAQCSNTLA